MKNTNFNRIRDLPASSAVPQPTTLPRTPQDGNQLRISPKQSDARHVENILTEGNRGGRLASYLL
jgi:hypothetical protein